MTIMDVEKQCVLRSLNAYLNPKLSSIQNSCAILRCRLWSVGLYHILTNYLLNGIIFGKKKILNIKLIKNIKRVF
jgi:hypothetical protein